MKIGIMTFHWAANYGAILQTHSLVNYLHEAHQAKTIDFDKTDEIIQCYSYTSKEYIERNIY